MEDLRPSTLRDLVRPPLEADEKGGIARVLHAVREHLGMDVAFVAEFRGADRVFQHVDAKAHSPVAQGDAVPLEQGYCQRVVDGRLPQLIPDARLLPAAAVLPETRAIPIGSHLSVPIRFSDGRLYGTFCCFSFEPDVTLGERDLQMMKVLAQILAEQIEQETGIRRERAERVASVQTLMEGGQPSIVYQPIYDLVTAALSGVEALSRFNSSPMRPPDAWFAEAASVGLGCDLESCAIRAALTDMERLPGGAYVAVNSSAELVLGGRLLELLQTVDLRRVVLEITEHASVTDYPAFTAALAPLRALGLRVAIDDTGAGYSSMRHILSIEPDLIKLDVSLTRGIDQDRKRRALATALIAFARETGTGIIAEGVETAAELATLRRLGVTRAQGFHLARPMPLSSLAGALELQESASPSAPTIPSRQTG